MPDYSKGKIYRIKCNITNDVYYGSTTRSLSRRKERHKQKSYSSREIIERGNYTFELIEEFPCKTKLELETRERWYIENNVCVNEKLPTRTYEEKIEYEREYKKKNKDRLRTQQNEPKLCECGSHYLQQGKARHLRTKKHLKYIQIKLRSKIIS